MVRFFSASAVMMILAGFVQAQTAPIPQPQAPVAGLPAAPAARPVVDPKVIKHLQGWEATMKGYSTFAVTANLTKKDLTTKRDSKFTADIWCMKPNLARMSLKKQLAPDEKANPNDMMAYICTGTGIYQYDGAQKKLTTIPLGKNTSGNVLLLDLMGGMTARDALARFDFTLLKEDASYIYLEVKPVLLQDKEEFQTMTMVLCNPENPATRGLEYVPRMVILRQANGQQEEVWDFPKPIMNPKEITKEHFVPQHPGKDWTIENIKPPAEANPGIRQTGSNGRIPTPGGGQ
jgi:TIGR03009 family protein